MFRTPIFHVLLVLAASAAFSPSSSAQCDPAQIATLFGTNSAGAPQFGYSAAVSADGSTTIVGANNDNSGIGAAYIFVRSGLSWVPQGPTLVPADGAGMGYFGTSVAISSDGNTALIGAYHDNGGTGAAYVFTRSGAAWTQQGPKLVPTGATGASFFGISVSLSGNGRTALIGAYRDADFNGAAYIFSRSGSAWMQLGPKLLPIGSSGHGAFGCSVALSADAGAALIGAFTDNDQRGAAYSFIPAAGTWTQQGPRLLPLDGAGQGQFGIAVSLDADGNRAVVGASADNSGVGAAYFFAHSNFTWTQQGAKLTPTGGIGPGAFGCSVALNADGDTAVIGAFRDNNSIGAAYLVTNEDALWSQHGTKLVPVGVAANARFGSSAAMNADGATLVIGAPNDHNTLGATRVFLRSPIIARQPANAATSPHGFAMFSIEATFTSPLSYRWRQNGSPLSDGPANSGAVISGASTPTLTVSGPTAADDGSIFDCLVTSACDSTLSSPATLTVSCAADFNGDQTVNIHDVMDFLRAWFADDPRADFDGNGDVAVNDIFAYLAIWFANC